MALRTAKLQVCSLSLPNISPGCKHKLQAPTSNATTLEVPASIKRTAKRMMASPAFELIPLPMKPLHTYSSSLFSLLSRLISGYRSLFGLAALLFTLFICTGCPKEPVEPEEVPFIEFEQEVLDFAYYKQGSWWLYEDSATGHEAQHYVLEDKVDTIELEDGPFHNPTHVGTKEQFEYQLHAWGQYFLFKGNAGSSSVTYRNAVYEGYSNYFMSQDYHTPFEGTNYASTTSEGPDTIRQDFLDSFIVNGESFPEVLRVHHTMNFAHLGHPETLYYLAKNHGIIRWEFYWYNRFGEIDSSQIWNLIDHQVVQ